MSDSRRREPDLARALSNALPSAAAAILFFWILFWSSHASAQSPRIAPLEEHESDLNVVKTIARHPDLMAAWLPFGGYVLQGNSLPARDREMLILRTAFLCKADYEWGHHARLARSLGMTDDEIADIAKGSGMASWSSFERALLRAAEELHRYQTISDRTWAYLDARYSDQQMMDVVFTVGEYTMVSMALKSFRVQREEGVEGLPASDP